MFLKNVQSQTPQYRISATSGLLTTVAARTSSAGHCFAFRWSSTALLALITRLKLRWQTNTAFTAAQEVAFKAFRLTGYTGSHSGGTQITIPTKKETRFAASAFGDARIGTTGALTAGTHTFDNQEYASLNLWSQSGAAPAVYGGESEVFPPTMDYPLLVLAQDEGICVTNEILMGAAGTGRLMVELDWLEVPK